jgi:aspartate-semialdehyde dehydrogenase
MDKVSVMSSFPIVIVGATGLVGSTLLSLIENSELANETLYLVASAQSAGTKIQVLKKEYVVESLEEFDFHKTKIAFFCVGNDLSSVYAPKAAAAGNIVIDKSFFFRNHPDVPLIVPEVNLDVLHTCKKMGIIANPNCNTIPVAVALKPIYDAVGISRINIATYQSVSGTGKNAVVELSEQSRQLLDDKPVHPTVYPQQIAFNVLPHIDDFMDNGFTREEMKIVWEMQKIYNDKTIAINPTAVRVPVFYGHSAAVHIETRDKISTEQALSLLGNANGVTLVTGKFPYPTPACDAAGKDNVYVGRVREDISHPKGLNLWVVADNLRRGAALNAIQIAKQLIGQRLLS